jgi:hypothetical protein
MDVWEYIKQERLEVPTIYFSHERECFWRGGQWLPCRPAHTDATKPDPTLARVRVRTNRSRKWSCRVRTIGDMISTGMIESPADSVDDIIAEVSRRPRHRTRHPRRRQSQRSRDGGPQESRIFLDFTMMQLHSDIRIESSASTPAGRVDDGKSTLIGRLLYDSKSLMEDQVEALGKVRRLHRRRPDQSRQPHRRPARRTRAGHHD